jgi:ribonuclease HI
MDTNYTIHLLNEFIAAFSCHMNAVLTPVEGEAWGLLKGLEWIATLGYNKVIIEMNYKMVVEYVNHPKANRSEYIVSSFTSVVLFFLIIKTM